MKNKRGKTLKPHKYRLQQDVFGQLDRDDGDLTLFHCRVEQLSWDPKGNPTYSLVSYEGDRWVNKVPETYVRSMLP